MGGKRTRGQEREERIIRDTVQRGMDLIRSKGGEGETKSRGVCATWRRGGKCARNIIFYNARNVSRAWKGLQDQNGKQG